MRNSGTGAIQTLREWVRVPNGKIAVSAILFVAAYLAWLVFRAPEATRVLVANVANVPLDFAAGISALLTSRVGDLKARTRRAWLLCAIAFFADGTGNLLWFIYQNVLGKPPSPSWADAGYLAYYPLMMYGLLLFPKRHRTWQESAKLWLDVATVIVAGGTVVWYILLAPALEAPHTGALDAALSLAYPLCDMVLLFACAVVLMRRTAPISRASIAMLALGGISLLVADLLYGYAELRGSGYTSGTWTDTWFQLAGLLWFLAAQYQRWRAGTPTVAPHAREEGIAGLSPLPYVAIPIGYAVLLEVARPPSSRTVAGVVLAVLVLTTLVIVRQFTAVQENRRLVADRATREARFRSLVQHSSDVITIIESDGTIQFVSSSVQRVFGWPPESVVGRNIADLVHPEDRLTLTNFLDQTRSGGGTASGVWRWLHAAGDWRHVEVIGTCQLDDPAVGGIVMNTRDISERTALEKELTHQAYHDALTGLANRVRFRAQVERALEQAGEEPSSVAVLFLDLDNFKNVNDSMGHAEGDLLLGEVAARLLKATRGSDIVARLGGDEFAVLLEHVATVENAITVAERVISAMRRPFSIDAGEVAVGASIGIASGEPGQGATELLRNADVAMYVAKRHRKGRYMMFETQMHAAVRDRLSLEADMRRAIDRRQFTLRYQPIVDLATGRFSGVEALARWEHPTRGELPPSVFIPLAEESNLIIPLGRLVLADACRAAAAWTASWTSDSPFTLAVNISGKQLHATLAEDVAAALQDSGLRPGTLLLEITESVVMRDTEATLERLRALKALGVRLAIDDFGTGYSSLAYLQRFPIDVLKIDKSFVDRVETTAQGASLANTIVALGNALSLRTVAEGVERVEQVGALRSMGCDFAQGFLFSPPVTSEKVAAMVGESLLTDALSQDDETSFAAA